jgi:hypothetical protein
MVEQPNDRNPSTQEISGLEIINIHREQIASLKSLFRLLSLNLQSLDDATFI